MSRPNFINSNVVYHDNSKEYNIDARGKDLASVLRACEAQDTQSKHQDKPEPEDVQAVDTSFFCTQQFSADIIEKNLRQAIHLASSKADACRRILALETYGYIVLSNEPDDRKAELINPFAAPRYIFTQDDFINARRRKSNVK